MIEDLKTQILRGLIVSVFSVVVSVVGGFILYNGLTMELGVASGFLLLVGTALMGIGFGAAWTDSRKYTDEFVKKVNHAK